MWSQKLKSGNVCYYERYKDPLTGRTRTATVTLKPTGRKSDAWIAETFLKQKIERLTAKQEVHLTFDKLCDKYVEHQGKEYKKQTQAAAVARMRRLVSLIGADVYADKLTAPIVEDRLSAEKNVTYNERLTRFKALMRWAYQSGYVDNISYLDRLQKKRVPPVRVIDAEKYLEHDEIDALLACMTIEKWRLLTEFLILSGLRIGEAIALNDKDVDTEHRYIHVTKTYSMQIHEISTTKTEMSERDVYMQDELLKCSMEIKKYMKEEQMKYAYRTVLFISDDDGNFFHYDAFRQYFGDCCERTIHRRLTPHALRHTHRATCGIRCPFGRDQRAARPRRQ